MSATSESSLKLIFVYNADSGLFNTITDIAHKIFSVDTYQCQLGNLTHGKLAMRDSWKKLIAQLPYVVEYLHADDYVSRLKNPALAYPLIDCPVIFLKRDQSSGLLSSNDINCCDRISALSKLISQKLSSVLL